MAENNNETTETEPTQTDIFQQQKKTIDTLVDVLERQGVGQPQQIIYATPAEPVKKSPNYLLYIGIGLAAFVLLGKVKL